MILAPTARGEASPWNAPVAEGGREPLITAQLPDSVAPPGVGDEEDGDEGDTTSVVLPAPGGKATSSDSTGAHAPAPVLLEPGAAPADSTLRRGPMVTKSPAAGTGTVPGPMPEAKPAARRGILGAHPAAIVLGLIAVHILVVKLITR